MTTATSSKAALVASCHKHPRYTAERKPGQNCRSCWLLYVLRYQFSKKAEEKLGALNPYAYLIESDGDHLEEALAGIEVQKKTVVAARC